MSYRRSIHRRRRPEATAEYNARLEAFRLPVPNDPRWWERYGCRSVKEWDEAKDCLDEVFAWVDDMSQRARYEWNYRDDDTLTVPTLDEFARSGQDETFSLA